MVDIDHTYNSSQVTLKDAWLERGSLAHFQRSIENQDYTNRLIHGPLNRKCQIEILEILGPLTKEE